MCFSATASFVAGTVLIAGGAVSLRRARDLRSRFLGFGAFPLLFGIQQMSEGVLWLSLDSPDVAQPGGAALVFLFFAYWFWPFWVPLSAALVEPDRTRQRLFEGLSAFGFCLGAALYLPVLVDPDTLDICLVRHSIQYENPVMFPGEAAKTVVRLVYALVICLPLLGSSHRQVRIFGALIVASVAAGFVFAAYAFTSIWCFLAALISGYIVYMMYALARDDRAGDPARRTQS
ncbi:hypothetical protein OEZ49_13925 [Ruegeria sp. WL0004]|uniref:Uncharacterized protein n=1 Tax=Ruegeria marisflavi TaxID=2984152 RepID=A0ABT2WUG6_9RHOB|nr:DUF6629 family protein [Ruegeria sp. WL0004]MCU9838872.1 hypothetical protein [Ruegeria sp. WL0004]